MTVTSPVTRDKPSRIACPLPVTSRRIRSPTRSVTGGSPAPTRIKSALPTRLEARLAAAVADAGSKGITTDSVIGGRATTLGQADRLAKLNVFREIWYVRAHQ